MQLHGKLGLSTIFKHCASQSIPQKSVMVSSRQVIFLDAISGYLVVRDFLPHYAPTIKLYKNLKYRRHHPTSYDVFGVVFPPGFSVKQSYYLHIIMISAVG